jgi:uncharacterized NAD(P)/FAD-binding protein YdhS
MKHFNEICEPYEYEKENATTGGIEIMRKLSDSIHQEKSLLRLVKQYLQQTRERDTNADEVVDEDEDQSCME